MCLTVVVNFNQSSYGVMEEDGTISITIILSQASSVEFQVTINALNVCAIGNLYYRIAGKFGKLTLFEPLTKESLVN